MGEGTERLWSCTAGVQVLAPPFTTSVGKLLSLSVPQFPQLLSEDNDRHYLRYNINELICVEHLAEYLAPIKYPLYTCSTISLSVFFTISSQGQLSS